MYSEDTIHKITTFFDLESTGIIFLDRTVYSEDTLHPLKEQLRCVQKKKKITGTLDNFQVYGSDVP